MSTPLQYCCCCCCDFGVVFKKRSNWCIDLNLRIDRSSIYPWRVVDSLIRTMPQALKAMNINLRRQQVVRLWSRSINHNKALPFVCLNEVWSLFSQSLKLVDFAFCMSSIIIYTLKIRCIEPTHRPRPTIFFITVIRSAELDVRLVSDSSDEVDSGRLEVLHDDEWGTVCDDDFDDNAARVACFMLGYGYISL